VEKPRLHAYADALRVRRSMLGDPVALYLGLSVRDGIDPDLLALRRATWSPF
jgi:hypothetical protein